MQLAFKEQGRSSHARSVSHWLHVGVQPATEDISILVGGFKHVYVPFHICDNHPNWLSLHHFSEGVGAQPPPTSTIGFSTPEKPPVLDGQAMSSVRCVIPHTDRPYWFHIVSTLPELHFSGLSKFISSMWIVLPIDVLPIGSIPRETRYPTKVHQRTVPGCCADHRQPLPKHLQGSWLWCWGGWGGPVAMVTHEIHWNHMK